MLLEVKNLKVKFKDEIYAVEDISFSLKKKDILALVGESGSGKSLTALAIMGLLPSNAVIEGKVILNGVNLLALNEKALSKIRGKEMSMIFQEPMKALNPLMTIESQIGEVIKEHEKLSNNTIKTMVLELLEKVKIPKPIDVLKKYPHELSGGMRQRVMIAMAIALKPKVLIADEPTTALDVTVQNEILELLKEINENMGMGIIFITHDLDVVSEIANRVNVMYLGKIVEAAEVVEFFDNSYHPYSKGLIYSRPDNIKESNRLHSIKGVVPDINNRPKGCGFNTRCTECIEICKNESPKEVIFGENHRVLCHIYRDTSSK